MFSRLADIDLEISKREVFGIAGPNGAGWSTELKVVSLVIRADGVRVVMRGRVALLLRHMKGEMERKLDEVLEFPSRGSFVDVPLRTHTTGMVAQLGFSVASVWLPDILPMDEVLAVADMTSQGKCRDGILTVGERRDHRHPGVAQC